MSVINISAPVDTDGSGPHTVSITLDKAIGNNRAVVVVAVVNGPNDVPNTCVFDPVGINEPMVELFDMVQLSTLSVIFISSWYILDADLPAGAGTFDIDITHVANVTGIGLIAYYLEDVVQSAPSSGTAEDNATSTPSLSTGAGATDTVIDVWNSNDNFGTYSEDSGQTETLDLKIGDQLGFSSYRTGSTDMGWTNDGAESRDHVGGYIVFEAIAAAIPTLDDVDGDEILVDAQQGFDVTTTDFDVITSFKIVLGSNETDGVIV